MLVKVMKMNFKIEDIFENDYLSVISISFLPLVAICVYGIGFYSHTKIIKISIKEKDMTWKLDITNSLILIFYYGFSLFMKFLTLVVQDLHTHTGRWICYVSRGISYCGIVYISAHTLVVAIMKYIMIVYWDRVMVFGKDKIKQFFFLINFLNPLIMILLLFIVRPDFLVVWDGTSQEIDRCLGDPKNNLDHERNHSLTKFHTLCELEQPPTENYLEYSGYLARSGICWVHLVTFYVVKTNVLEVLFYTLIFNFMCK